MTSRANFDEAPIGAFWSSTGVAHFCVRADLWGIVLWGQLTSGGGATVAEALARHVHDARAVHDFVVDARGLEGVEPRAFSAFAGFVTAHHRVGSPATCAGLLSCARPGSPARWRQDSST